MEIARALDLDANAGSHESPSVPRIERMLSRIVWFVASIVAFNILLVATVAVVVLWLHWLGPTLEARRARRRTIERMLAVSAVAEEPSMSTEGKASHA